MSTQLPTTAAPEHRPTVDHDRTPERGESDDAGDRTAAFTAANAPRTFDPFNTRSCPDGFEDRWRATSDRPDRY